MKLMNILFVLSLVVVAAACNKKEEAPPPAEEVPAAEVMSTPESEVAPEAAPEGDEVEAVEEVDEGA